MAKTYYHGFCHECRTGSQKADERAAQQWSDNHNRVKHQGQRVAAPAIYTLR
ncbi:hypothetical protein [Micromonospora sp. NPDC004704]